MPGRSAITCKCTQDLRDSVHQMAEARGISVNSFVHNIIQSYVVTGKAECLPTVLPQSVGNARQQALALLDSSAPALIQMLLDKAQSGDRESAIYCLDRLMGKPRQQVDQRILKVDASGEEFRAMVAQLLQSGGSKPPQIAPPSGTQTSEPLASEG
mgnify:CR=1 FL=1